MILRLSFLAMAGTLALAGQAHAADVLPVDKHLASTELASDVRAQPFRPVSGAGVVNALGAGSSAVTYL